MRLVISEVLFIPDPIIVHPSDQEELRFRTVIVGQQVHGEGHTVIISTRVTPTATTTARSARVTKIEDFAVSKVATIIYNLAIIRQILCHLGQKLHRRMSQKYSR
jgi:hypothetical protein